MPLNLLYVLLLLLASPWLLYKSLTTGKYRQGMLRKLLGLTPIRTGDKPCAWFHAVSVGEVLLLKPVIGKFRQRHSEWECVLSTTTNTGFDVAKANYHDLCVFYWPLDFSWAVRRALRRIRPDLVVLAELELWPNFIRAAKRRAVTAAVINGRMSPRSFRGYRRIRWFMKRLLRKIDLLAVQNDDYAKRLLELGAPPKRVFVTGSVKYDGVTGDRTNPKTRELAQLLAIGDQDLVWIAGSTQEPEEQIALDMYRKAKPRFENLRLIIVPRHKERFEEVAGILQRSGLPFIRRSQISHPVTLSSCHPVILLDTLGELGALWGLADVAFVGGSIHPRGGQNMIEPAAYGAAVTFGPHVWNFKETVDRLLEHRAAVQVNDAAELERETLRLLGDPAAQKALGEAARQFVQSQQGATERTLELLEGLVTANPEAQAA
jgi:3-deoxy-D-manno-octulosonic-acid transferase